MQKGVASEQFRTLVPIYKLYKGITFLKMETYKQTYKQTHTLLKNISVSMRGQGAPLAN